MPALVNDKKQEVYYRDLTAAELCAISNIKNAVIRNEFAANVSVINIDPADIDFASKVQIGEDILYRSSRLLEDPQVLDVVIAEFKEIINTDPIMAWLSHLTKYFPGTSIIDLLNLNVKDIVELIILAEGMSGDKIFGAKKKGMSLVNPADLPDGGKALRDQIRELNNNTGMNGLPQSRPS